MAELNLQEKSLGQILQSMGLIRPDQLKRALEEQRKSGELLGRILVKAGWVSEKDIIHALKGLLIVTFQLGEQFFGLEAYYVLEIVRLSDSPLPLPQVPPYVKGIIHFRNRIVPVMDLRLRFGLEAARLSEGSRLIVCEMPNRSVGLLVDRVGAVLRLHFEDLVPLPNSDSGIPKKYLYGLGKLENSFCTILKLEALMESKEAITLHDQGR